MAMDTMPQAIDMAFRTALLLTGAMKTAKAAVMQGIDACEDLRAAALHRQLADPVPGSPGPPNGLPARQHPQAGGAAGRSSDQNRHRQGSESGRLNRTRWRAACLSSVYSGYTIIGVSVYSLIAGVRRAIIILLIYRMIRRAA
jgi:hypothetical protein